MRQRTLLNTCVEGNNDMETGAGGFDEKFLPKQKGCPNSDSVKQIDKQRISHDFCFAVN